jgi:hypothetical protein
MKRALFAVQNPTFSVRLLAFLLTIARARPSAAIVLRHLIILYAQFSAFSWAFSYALVSQHDQVMGQPALVIDTLLLA